MNAQKLNDNRYILASETGNRIGEFYREVDGIFVFWPQAASGFYTEGFLREVADKLRDMNKEWNETIEKELKR